MKKTISILIIGLVAGTAHAALIGNGDLNAEPIISTDNSGTTAYKSNVGTDDWFITAVSRGFTYDGSGGDTGEGGAFVKYDGSDSLNQKPRGVLQFAQDDKAATGLQSFGIDVFMDDNTGANELTFLVELYGWDATSPGLSIGGATANDPTWNATDLNSATTILNTSISKSSVADASWQTVDLGDVDVGTGYNNYAWRIGIMGQTDGDEYAFDNVTASAIPEPATLGLVGTAGLAMLLLRRRLSANK